MVYFCQPELPFDVSFCKVTDHILPMIFGLASNSLDQATNIENIIFLFFGHATYLAIICTGRQPPPAVLNQTDRSAGESG